MDKKKSKLKKSFIVLFVIAIIITSTIVIIIYNSQKNEFNHPRLLFEMKEIQEIKRNIHEPPYNQIIQNIKNEIILDLDIINSEKDVYADSRIIRNYCTLYIFTGEKRYANKAKDIIEKMLDDDEFWKNKSSKGLTRAAMALGVSISYDLCYNAWNKKFNEIVSGNLSVIATEMMQTMGQGHNTRTASNWQAVRYSAAGLAFLASDVNETFNESINAYNNLTRYLNILYPYNGKGWNQEGIGYTNYAFQFIGPFGIASKRLLNKDLRKDIPLMSDIVQTSLIFTLPISKGNNTDYGIYPDFSNDNPHWHSQGIISNSFFYINDLLPGIKWKYDHLVGEYGDQSYDTQYATGLYSLIFYPRNITYNNPNEYFNLNYADEIYGAYMFRNKYLDKNDIIAMTKAVSRIKPGIHSGPDNNNFRLIGLDNIWITGGGRTANPQGQSTLFYGNPNNLTREINFQPETIDYFFKNDGTGSGYSINKGSSTGVENHIRNVIVEYKNDNAIIIIADYIENDEENNLTINNKTKENISKNNNYINKEMYHWRLNTPEWNNIEYNDNKFKIISPDNSILFGEIISPLNFTIEIGSFSRGTSYNPPLRYKGNIYTNNTWIDVISKDSNFVIILYLTKNITNLPEFNYDGYSINWNITYYDSKIKINYDNIEMLNINQYNLKPFVNIKYPINNSVYKCCKTINFDIDSYDIDGNISRLDLYVNNQKYQSLYDLNYNFKFTPNKGGQYNFYVISYDNNGAKKKSEIINIYVNDFNDYLNKSINLSLFQINKLVNNLDFNDYLYPLKTNETNEWRLSSKRDWIIGFFPTQLWLLYNITGDTYLKENALNWTESLIGEENKSRPNMGFIILYPFRNAYLYTNNSFYNEIIIKGSNSFAKLYDYNSQSISSEFTSKNEIIVLIDTMMNLEILYEGAKLSNNQTLKEMAINHSLNVIQNQIRPDGSTIQKIAYNKHNDTKRIIKWQGLSQNSTWSRGQAWAIYGFTVAYRETKKEIFLDTIKRLSNYYISNIPEDYIPLWDFNANLSSNQQKDSSAAAIATSAFLELSIILDDELGDYYYNIAYNTLKNLMSETYLRNYLENGILKNSCYTFPDNSTTIWGDNCFYRFRLYC